MDRCPVGNTAHGGRSEGYDAVEFAMLGRRRGRQNCGISAANFTPNIIPE
jgi:hypothetical protein